MNSLDVVLVVIVLAYAVSGYVQGFVGSSFPFQLKQRRKGAGLVLDRVLDQFSGPRFIRMT